MNREKFTAKIVRIIETLESGTLPAPVKALYVFGSYARGALKPNDLDLIVVHDRLDERILQVRCKAILGPDSEGITLEACRELWSEFKRAFRRPGERVEVIMASDLKAVTGDGSQVKPTDPVLLWSDTDRDWRPKLEAICLNPTAGRAPRNHIFPLKRLGDHIGSMQRVTKMIADGALLFERIPVASIALDLTPENTQIVEETREYRLMGKKSLEVLPYALWWLQHEGVEVLDTDRTVVWGESFTRRVEIGRPSLEWMLGVFRERREVKRQCLIPHFKRSGPNDLLVFEPGSAWSHGRDYVQKSLFDLAADQQ